MENIKTYLQNTANFQVIEQKCKNNFYIIKFYVKNNEILYIEYDCEMYYFEPNDEDIDSGNCNIMYNGLDLNYYNLNKTKRLQVECSENILYITSYYHFNTDKLILSLQL
jgi:hypothetical protein